MSDDLAKMPAGAKPAFLPADYQDRDRLRDAAPAMLKVLKAIAKNGLESNGLGRGGDVLISESEWRAAIAVIAKAEGRS